MSNTKETVEKKRITQHNNTGINYFTVTKLIPAATENTFVIKKADQTMTY